MNDYNIDYNLGIVNRGNTDAIIKVMQKAMQGKDITVGFLGGSITQGSLSSTPQTCYAYLTYEWWQKAFPDSKVTYVNAGVGGTSSQFGVARVGDDLLDYKPDFCVVEFSVNDENTAHYEETYEGLIRRMLNSDKNIAILLVHNIYYDGNGSAEEVHRKVGSHYDLPSVSMRTTLYPLVKDGIIAHEEVTPDDLHPNDKGHRILSENICNFLEKVRKEAQKEKLVSERSTLPNPITPNRYEHSVRLRCMNDVLLLDGFEKDDKTTEGHFKKGWTAWKKGNRIALEVEGTSVAVQYRKTINKPSPIAKVIVDDNEDTIMILDGNFEETWGDCLYLDTVVENLEMGMHKVEIVIEEAHEEDKMPFYLLSVIGAC